MLIPIEEVVHPSGPQFLIVTPFPWPGKLAGDFCNSFEALASPGEA